jgi:hypothetical protein
MTAFWRFLTDLMRINGVKSAIPYKKGRRGTEYLGDGAPAMSMSL